MMRRQLLPALGMLLVFTVITGLAYPLVVTGVAQGLFADKANGSRVEVDGQLVGSASIGQPFSAAEYFHPRPSAAGYAPGPGYSFGSNFGPTNETFLFGEDDPETADVDESETDGVDDLVRAYRETNGLDAEALVPVDAVTSSASGLDPHISVANARIQAQRVADSRGLDVDQVLELVQDNTDGRDLGFLGEPGVNVLLLNLALDQLG
jgi:potassium-transporting ATPase KdpC subunit